jgi:hypothetical protein
MISEYAWLAVVCWGRAPWTLDASMDDLYQHLHSYYMHAGYATSIA